MLRSAMGMVGDIGLFEARVAMLADFVHLKLRVLARPTIRSIRSAFGRMWQYNKTAAAAAVYTEYSNSRLHFSYIQQQQQ